MSPPGSAAPPASAAALTPIGHVPVKDVAFNQYKANVYSGPFVYPDFSGAQKQFRQYRTKITEGAKAGVNFAGHYALVEFGCGAGCGTGYIVDLQNGAVHELGYGGEDQLYLNLDGKPDSRLLKVSYSHETTCVQEAATWDGSRFQVIAREISSVPTGQMGMDCPSITTPATTAAPAETAVPEGQPTADITNTAQANDLATTKEAEVALQTRAQAAKQRDAVGDAVRGMVSEGQTCFDNQNYTCAITNASNALRLRPSDGAARELKSRAEAAQSQAMNNIDIH